MRWNNLISKQSCMSNGVKQGSCVSTTLFSLYINGNQILVNTIRINICAFTVMLI